MLRTQITLLFCSLVFYFSIQSQSASAPIRYGKVPKEDLQMNVYEQDSMADAVVLCNLGKLSVEYLSEAFKCRFSHHKRIKILKETGFTQGDIAIPYYSYKKREGISRVHVNVFGPDGSKTTMKKDDFFEEKINEYWSIVKFSCPNLQVGSVLEYRYEILSEFLSELKEWYFQEDIPVRYSELQVDLPKYYAYTYLFQGGEGMNKVVEPDGTTILKGNNGTFILESQKYVMKDAVGLREEAFVTTMDDYLGKIRFQLSEIRYPDGRVEPVMSTWSELVNELEHRPSIGYQITKKRNHKKILETVMPLIEDMKTQKEKAQFLYNYFGQTMEWDGYSGVGAKSSLDEAFEKKQGTFSEMNMMLLVALKAAGITAYPLFTSTRAHGKMYEKFPLFDQFNLMLVYTFIDGSPMILDIGDHNRPMGYPRVQALNRRGWLMQSSPEWVDIKPQKGEDIFAYTYRIDEEGTLSGTIESAFKGYAAIQERNYYEEDKEAKFWVQRLEDNYPEINLDSVSFENLDSLHLPFKDNIKITIPEAAQVVGDFIYFSPVLYSNFDENIFTLEERTYPVDIPYPFSEQIVSTIQIPKGYAIEELPEPVYLSLPKKGGKFRYAIQAKSENEIQVVARLSIEQLQFLPAEYGNIKELFDMVVEKFGEQVVLKKKP